MPGGLKNRRLAPGPVCFAERHQESLPMPAIRYVDVFTGRRLSPPGEDVRRLGQADAAGWLVGPAFFDPQVNGYAGVDFNDPAVESAAIESAVAAMSAAGCDHLLITLITAPDDFYEHQLDRLAGAISRSRLLTSAVLGIHLEGPSISPRTGYAGAHDARHARGPDWARFQRWQTISGGRIRLVTLAPEWESAESFIRAAAGSGVQVALGHTDASLEQLNRAVRAGARLFTHLGNACPPEIPRHDNIIQRVLAVPELTVSLIPDGIHLPPFVLSNLARTLGPARLAMTTDAAPPAGAACGRFRFAGRELDVGEDRVVKSPGSPGYFGSALSMIEGFYNCIAFGGLSADLAWRAWTHLRRRFAPEIQPSRIAVPFGIVPPGVEA